jgi:DNA-binding transcriptional MerR regulator
MAEGAGALTMAERLSIGQAVTEIRKCGGRLTKLAPRTLRNWDRKLVANGILPQVARDRNNWRSYSAADIEKIIEWAQKVE